MELTLDDNNRLDVRELPEEEDCTPSADPKVRLFAQENHCRCFTNLYLSGGSVVCCAGDPMSPHPPHPAVSSVRPYNGGGPREGALDGGSR